MACPPSGGCTIVGRDGTTYPDMQTFVDESPDVEPGDQVLANADPTNPDKKPKFVTFTRSDGLGWGWYAGGGALLALLLVAGWLIVRRLRAASDRPDLSG